MRSRPFHSRVLGILIIGTLSVWIPADSAVSKSGAPRSGGVVTPETPAPPATPVEPVTAPGKVPRDSIYARDIRIDAGGIVITDRDGRLIRLDVDRFIPPDPPRWDEPGRELKRQSDIVHIFADVLTIERDQIVNGDVVCMFGGHVDVFGRVEGSVVSIFGTINVEGTVRGDAVAPLGAVRVGPNGLVEGDVVASRIEKEPGGHIAGVRNQLPLNLFGSRWADRPPYWGQATLTALVTFKILFAVFLVLLAHALAAHNVARVKNKIQLTFFKSFFMGVAIQVLSLPVVLLLVVTIIGIPVAVFLLPLLGVAAVVLSLAAFGLWVGELINQNTTVRLDTGLSRTLTGFLALQSVWLIPIVALWGSQVEGVGESLRVIGIVSLGLGAVMWYVIVTTGLGAVLLTRFGTRPKELATDLPPGSGKSALHEEPVPPVGPSPLPRRTSDEPGAAPAAG